MDRSLRWGLLATIGILAGRHRHDNEKVLSAFGLRLNNNQSQGSELLLDGTCGVARCSDVAIVSEINGRGAK